MFVGGGVRSATVVSGSSEPPEWGWVRGRLVSQEGGGSVATGVLRCRGWAEGDAF